MKTIQISDEDYDAIMELSKELQKQENHSQAFPYFWEPASEKLVPNIHDEGEVVEIFHSGDQELYSPQDFAEHEYDLWKRFLCDRELPEGPYPQIKDKDEEHEWIEYIKDEDIDDISIFTSDWEQSTDHNPSLFLSDVQGYIKGNKHHLGRNPRTYARTVHRMPKMKRLIEIIYRINPQPAEDINDEARRFVIADKELRIK